MVESKTTVVVYMPGREFTELSASLLDAGLEARTPCIFVSAASLPTQRLKRTTIGELRNANDLPAPSLLIIGWVADPAVVADFWNTLQHQRVAEEKLSWEIKDECNNA